jgi:2-polyprenyl-6-hydroxyphenyl methylase/3-demethylubiquinone-9 3-methyltransferase
MTKTTIDPTEVAKFAQYSTEWWNTEGPLKTLHDINPARLAFIEQTITFAGQTILDIGCGGGILCEAMASRGARVTGLDVEAAAISTAKEHAVKSQLPINYVCEAIETFQAPAFDMITCMEMLEHVASPALVIEHCARLLKDGGMLFLSTLNRTVKAYATAVVAAEYVLELLPRQTHDIDKFIKPHELAQMVRKAGFDVIGLSGISYNPFTREAVLTQSVSVNYLLACQKA